MSRHRSDPSFWDDHAMRPNVPAPLVPFAERVLAEVRLRRGSTVLDIATGFGTMAVAAASAGMRVLAIDHSPGMVAQVASYGAADIDAKVMDGRRLEIETGSFDAAFSMFGVTLFDDWRAGFGELGRAVRPGGAGAVATWTSADGAAGSRLLAQCCAELFADAPPPVGPDGMEAMRDRDTFVATMESAGFGDVPVIEMTVDIHVDRADVADPNRLFTFSSQWPRLGPDERARVISHLEELCDRGGGTVAVPSTAAIALGVR